jgi:hypothetical protein
MLIGSDNKILTQPKTVWNAKDNDSGGSWQTKRYDYDKLDLTTLKQHESKNGAVASDVFLQPNNIYYSADKSHFLILKPDATLCTYSTGLYSYKRSGGLCYPVCPPGFQDQGLLCSNLKTVAKDSYGRGIGYPASHYSKKRAVSYSTKNN